MDKFFKLKANGTTVRTELLAGLTTFLTMAYILVANPDLLGFAGMDTGAVFTATALSAAIGTIVMALWAKLPFALAPGMGLNAFFAFTVVIGMGKSWQFALTAVLIEGIIFLILTAFNVREAIINAIPSSIKKAIAGGIGLFIAFIGLQNAGIIIDDGATLVTIGEFSNSSAIVGLIGIVLTGILLVLKVKGALLIGILGTTIIGIPFGVTIIPESSAVVSAPPSLEPIFFQFQFDQILTVEMLVVVFTFLFVDMFDTVGTLVGVTTKAKMLDKDGRIPRVKQALFADAIATTAGAMLGTSTVTTYVESASGVEEGGRTGLTALTTGILFLVALFFSPIFLLIPGAATAPALVIVGVFMASPIREIDFDDFSESIPAFLTLIMMPLSYSIAEGIKFGVLSFIFIKLFTGKHKQVSVLTLIVGVFFLVSFFI